MRPRTIECILCKGLVAYSKDDRTRFNSHMNIEHGISHSLSFILAGCLMNEEEREAVANIIEEREEKINSIVSHVDSVPIDEGNTLEERSKRRSSGRLDEEAEPIKSSVKLEPNSLNKRSKREKHRIEDANDLDSNYTKNAGNFSFVASDLVTEDVKTQEAKI